MRSLTPEEEARAHQLHRDSVVIDALGPRGPAVWTDEMLQMIEEKGAEAKDWADLASGLEPMMKETLLSGGFPEFWDAWDQSGVTAVSTTMGPFGPKGPFTYENAVRDLASMHRFFDSLPQYSHVRKVEDVEIAKKENRYGLILNFQNTTHIGDDLDNLEMFYNLGIRVIQLTYNSRNLVGDGCTERSQGGLTHFGVKVVAKMNELGILVDLSHCGERTTLEAIEVSDKPVAITHSICKSVYEHDRGKSDEVIKTIGEANGFFGVLLLPFFLTAEPEATLETWLTHFDRAVELAGTDHVGIGTDTAGEMPKVLTDLTNKIFVDSGEMGFRPEHRVDLGAHTKGFESWTNWPNLTRALVSRGFSDDEIKGFLGFNFLRVFREAVG